MKILNLYACLGGNRYKWNEVKSDIEVTAVELDAEAARLYQERFPNDKVIVADAHQYLLDHYKEFDFIWSSPPCPTHSRINISQKNNWKMKYPDFKLYEEIVFLDNWFNGKYCVENVIPYYEPLFHPKKRGRHLYWTNFSLPHIKERDAVIRRWQIPKLQEHHDIDISDYRGKQSKRKLLRNLVDYEAGRTIFETVLGIYKSDNAKQTTLF